MSEQQIADYIRRNADRSDTVKRIMSYSSGLMSLASQLWRAGIRTAEQIDEKLF